MQLKSTFFLFVVFAAALAQPMANDEVLDETTIQSIVNDEIPLEETRAQPIPDDVNLEEARQLYNPLQQVPQILSGQRPTIGNIIDRITDATRLTIEEERLSIKKALNSIKEAGSKGVKAGLDTAATGLDIILAVPKFGSKVLASTAGQSVIKT